MTGVRDILLRLASEEQMSEKKFSLEGLLGTCSWRTIIPGAVWVRLRSDFFIQQDLEQLSDMNFLWDGSTSRFLRHLKLYRYKIKQLPLLQGSLWRMTSSTPLAMLEI